MNDVNLCWRLTFCKMIIKLLQRNSYMLYRDNVHADWVGEPTPGSRSLIQVHTNVHCCHWLPEELSNKGYQTYQRLKIPEDGSITGACIWVLHDMPPPPSPKLFSILSVGLFNIYMLSFKEYFTTFNV